MRLRDLLKYDYIVIQCHDDPDADAIGSGFGVYHYLRENGKKAELVYSGKNKIKKSNLTRMVELLQIPISYVDKIPKCDLLLTVDCQYGEGNVTKFHAPEIAVIDHHIAGKNLPHLSEVQSKLGSCATLVWSMMKNEAFDPNGNRNVATALYYGLYMDTGAFAELAHPMDRDLRDQANVDENIISVLRNSNMSIEELETAGTALLRTDLMEEYRCAIVKANRCDPNILGIISDMVLEVDVIDACVVFVLQPTGVKYSVRSCVKETTAEELALVIAKGIGSGGGHKQKAGGFLQLDLLTEAYKTYCEENHLKLRMETDEYGKHIPTASACKALIEYRIRNYFENTSIIDAAHFKTDDLPFLPFSRRHIAYGYVRATDLFEVHTPVIIRSVDEEDMEITIQEGMILIISEQGDVTAISELAFEKQYVSCDWNFRLRQDVYHPTIRIKREGSAQEELMSSAKICIPSEEQVIQAAKLIQNVKLFELWNEKEYHTAKAGDYLILGQTSTADLRLQAEDRFESTYEVYNENRNAGVKAVVFDLDGTLLNTLEDLADAVNAALGSVKQSARTLDEVRAFVGNGVELLMSRSMEGGREDKAFDRAFLKFKEHYKEHNRDKTKPYEGILELMTELKRRGIRMAIVSNKLDPAVKDLCRAYFADFVEEEAAIGEREDVLKKPAPDSALAALKQLGVSPQEALYVGDSDVDIETAANAGMECISVAWGFRDSKFLQLHGATNIIELPQELLHYL